MKKLEEKWNGILYEGGFDNFSVNGTFHMERDVLYKNNPAIEARKRLDMAYILLRTPQMISTIQKGNAHFFHGTNANALPSILIHGLNSVDKSTENNIAVTTGEESTRINGKRGFISITDSIDEALQYANITSNDNAKGLLNFGVVIGVSLEEMSNVKTVRVISDIPEIGIADNLPVTHIKFIAVPDDKVEFVEKMVGQKNIEVVSMNMLDSYFIGNYIEKLSILEEGREDSPQVEELKGLKNFWDF